VQELGGNTARLIAKLAGGNIPYQGHGAQHISGNWPGGRNPQVLRASARDRLCNRSLGTEKNSTVYHLFRIFFIIITVITIITVIPSFVVLLNCLYLNLQILLFVHSHPHPAEEGDVK